MLKVWGLKRKMTVGLSVRFSQHSIKATVHSDCLYNNLIGNKNNSDKNVSINLLWLYLTATCYDRDRSTSGGFKINAEASNSKLTLKWIFIKWIHFSHKDVWNNLALNIKNPLNWGWRYVWFRAYNFHAFWWVLGCSLMGVYTCSFGLEYEISCWAEGSMHSGDGGRP
jgi:hypothetical protein